MKHQSSLSILGFCSFMILAAGCNKDKEASSDIVTNIVSLPLESADATSVIPESSPLPPTVSEVLEAELSSNPTLPELIPSAESEVKTAETEKPIAEETPPLVDEEIPQDDTSPAVPEGFAIRGIASQGDGCPSDSTAINISEDKKAFTVSFSQFELSLEAGSKRSEIACRLRLSMDVPVGWQYAVASFNYRGFLALDAGVEALHVTRYFFSGRDRGGGFRHKEIGEISKDFVYSDQVDILTSVLSREWSDCKGSRDLNIDTALRLRNSDLKKFPDATGIFTNDSIDGELSQEFGLIWRRCR